MKMRPLLLIPALLASAYASVQALPTLAASAAAAGLERASAEQAERRTALVIGNGAYKVGPLINPVNDARLVASSLAAARFKVIKLENATQEQMLKALSDFGAEIDKGGVGVFYFAGHGVQVGRQNYLIPVDANISREEQIRTRALNAQEVLDRMASAGNTLNLLFLDACRDDPFPRSTRGANLGLAKMDAALGMLVSFATAPGSVADDGGGRNSPYSKYLAESMRIPELRIEDVLKRVRTRVREETDGRQITWDSSSIEGDFYFLPKATTAVEAAPAQHLGGSGVPAARLPAAALTPQTSVARASPEARPTPFVATSLLPKPGDTWTYRFRSNWRTVGERMLVHRVDAVSKDEIRETMSVQGSAERGDAKAFGSDAAITARQAAGISVFELNPYLQAYMPLDPGTRWKSLTIPDGGGLLTGWNAAARVTEREKITVPAGEFDALRIELDANRTPLGATAIAIEPARIDHVLWYAPAVKRIVKHQRSVFSGNSKLLDRDLVELVEYELR
jgi:hypothetical protein